MLPRLQPKSPRLKSGRRTTACTGPLAGIDIEPISNALAALKNHPWRLVTTLVPNALDSKRMERAQQAYSAMIGQIQSQGYPVETYTLPYGPVEQMVHTTVLDRLLGTVDVRAMKKN